MRFRTEKRERNLGHFKIICICHHAKNISLTCFLGHFILPPPRISPTLDKPDWLETIRSTSNLKLSYSPRFKSTSQAGWSSINWMTSFKAFACYLKFLILLTWRSPHLTESLFCSLIFSKTGVVSRTIARLKTGITSGHNFLTLAIFSYQKNKIESWLV